MNGVLWVLSTLLVAGAVWFGSEGESSGAGRFDRSSAGDMASPFGGKEDVRRAKSLRRTIRGYRNWTSYPGLEGWQPGKSPHDKMLKHYLNSVAARNPANPGDGYLIVKENHMARDPNTLAAVTVIKKIRGYDPDNADRIWVKFNPKGEVMTHPKGMKLPGHVVKGFASLVTATPAGGDSLFVNDERIGASHRPNAFVNLSGSDKSCATGVVLVARCKPLSCLKYLDTV